MKGTCHLGIAGSVSGQILTGSEDYWGGIALTLTFYSCSRNAGIESVETKKNGLFTRENKLVVMRGEVGEERDEIGKRD